MPDLSTVGLRIAATEAVDFRARVVIPLPPRPRGPDLDRWRPAVDIVIPVHNQEAALEPGVRRLHAFLLSQFPFTVRITIADDASSDGTRAVAEKLASELDGVHVLRINRKGRGRALAAAWLTSEARVVAYMDIQAMRALATLPALVAPVMAGRSDISVGRHGHHRLRAMRADAARRLIPNVAGRGWSFDSELMSRARQAGLRIQIAVV